MKRRQTYHLSHQRNTSVTKHHLKSTEVVPHFEKSQNTLSVPRIIPQGKSSMCSSETKGLLEGQENMTFLTVTDGHRRPSVNSWSSPCDTSPSGIKVPTKSASLLLPTVEPCISKSRKSLSEGHSTTNLKTPIVGKTLDSGASRTNDSSQKDGKSSTAAGEEDLDVQSIINERRPSKLKGELSSMVYTFYKKQLLYPLSFC